MGKRDVEELKRNGEEGCGRVEEEWGRGMGKRRKREGERDGEKGWGRWMGKREGRRMGKRVRKWEEEIKKNEWGIFISPRALQ